MKTNKTIYRASDEQELHDLQNELMTLTRIKNAKSMYCRFIRVAYIADKIVITEKCDSKVKEDVKFDNTICGHKHAFNYINSLPYGQGSQPILRELSA